MRSACPSADELLAFHVGNLAESEVDRVTDHLETCAACDAAVKRLDDAVDPLISALRKPVPHSSSLFRSGGGSQAGPDLLAPENWPALPGYEILGALGRGGMGVVYQARHLKLNRLVALKRFRTGKGREVVRSRIEAESLSRVQHPNIVQIYEIIEHASEIYLALELVEGGTLGAKLKGKPQPPRETAELLEAVARAVHVAHSHGIIHRDLKPSNILLRKIKDGPEEDATGSASFIQTATYVPKLTDFSIAKRLTEDSGETHEGDVVGTPAYMSPEQAGGLRGTIGPATDVYGMGVILYEMLTGRVPLQGPTTLETLILLRNEEPVPPRRLVPRVPRDLETICLKCLEKEPAKRYGSALELADDLRHFRDGEPIKARPTAAWERAWKWAKRRPVVAGLSAALLFVTILGFILVASQWLRAEAEATKQKAARKEAEDNEQREKEARRQLVRLSARVSVDQGVNLCEAGEVERGMLWLARALERAVLAGDADLENVARLNLASWRPYLGRLRGECPHMSWVWSVDLSPDGRTALTGSPDCFARFWDAATAEPLGGALQHPIPIWSAKFSPDGKKVLTASCGWGDMETQAYLWDVASGEELVRTQAVNGKVVLAAFLPDGQNFVLVGTNEARVFRADDGEPAGPPMPHPCPPNPDPRYVQELGAALSADGKLLATGGEDGLVRLWNPATGQRVGEPLLASGPVTAVAISPDGKTVVSGSMNGDVQLWDVARHAQRGAKLRHLVPIRVITFSPDGEVIAVGGGLMELDKETRMPHVAPGEVRLWRAATGQHLGGPLPHPQPVWSLAFSPEGRLLLTGCEDGGARFFCVANGMQVGKTLQQEGTVTAVAISSDGRTAFASCAGAQSARLWDAPPEHFFGRQLLQGGLIGNLVFSPDGRLLLTGTEDGIVRLWDVTTGQLAAPLERIETRITALAFSADGRSFVTGSIEGDKTYLRLWDTATGRVRYKSEAPGWVYAAAFCPDGRTVLLGGAGEAPRYWEPGAANQPTCLLPKAAPNHYTLEYGPAGQTILTADNNGACLWNAATGQLVQEFKQPGGTRATFYPPEGDKVLLLTDDFLHVRETATGRDLGSPPFHSWGRVHRAQFSPDGRLILTCTRDWIAQLWDVRTGKRVGTSPSHDGACIALFTPDSKRLAAAGHDGRIALWDVVPPLKGDVERVRLWVEVLTAMELDGEDMIRPLPPAAVTERRRRIEELGGFPD